MADEQSSMQVARTLGDGDDTIYEMAGICEDLLRSCHLTLESSGSSNSILFEEYEQRFTAWAEHLGVFAKRSISLDRRLQHHPDIQDLVVRYLDILNTNLKSCKYRHNTPVNRQELNRL